MNADAEFGIGGEAAVPPATGLHGAAAADPTLHAVQMTDAAPESTAMTADAGDVGPQAAAAQTLGRPHAPVLEPLRLADNALPHASFAGSGFAIPADQLVPAMLSSLQVEGSAAWALLRQAPFRSPAAARDPVPDGRDAAPGRDDDAARADADSDDAPPDRAARDTTPVVDASRRDWCRPLTHALQTALGDPHPPRALSVAADQWQRGRCVVLACPQQDGASGPAWAHVLWPQLARGVAVRSLALQGLRVVARLHWTRDPQPGQWWHARMIKEHHPRRGRQLVAMGAGGGAAACTVQLGPVVVTPPRLAEVVLRIDAVRGFWAALGSQWSVHVVVAARVLGTACGRPSVEVE